MDRRSFIKLTAIAGAGVSAASCDTIEHQLIRFIPEEELVPGVAQWKPSVCPLCRSGCGLSVRVMEADAEVVRNGQPGLVRMGVAKKLEGSLTHPISQGGLCARGQAGIQVTYHPDRIRHPLKRSGSRGNGRFEEVSWEEAITELLSHLDGLETAGDQQALALVMRPVTGQRRALVEQFLARFGAPGPVAFEFFDEEVLRRANDLSFGRAQLPTFDLANARYVISFGADFLGTWNSPVAQSAAYGRMRQSRPGVRGALVQVEARMTQTGANADHWVPVRPGTEGVLALGLAHVIIRDRLRPADRGAAASRAGALIEGWSAGLTNYAPDRVEKLTGVAASRVERLAREFAEFSPAVAIIGGPPLAHTNGLFSALAVNALNALVGGVGEPGGVFFTPQLSLQATGGSQQARTAAPQPRSIAELASIILATGPSSVQVLLIDDANPVFATPPAWRVREAVEKVPFIASFGSFLDETSVLADLILPDHSFLESWIDRVPESGASIAVASVAPPAMLPLHQTRAMPDVLLEIARRLGRPLELPWPTFEDILNAAFASLPPEEAGGDPWAAARTRGGWWGEPPEGIGTASSTGEKASARTFAFAEPQFDGEGQQYPFHFLPYASNAFLDGSLAHLPWLQELPDPLVSAMWSSWVEINPATAERLGIRERDVVEIASGHGAVQVAAILSPGLAPDMVAMPVGQGHQTFTRYASGRGANPIGIVAPVAEAETGALAWAATRVRITRVSDPDDRLIMFAGETREHPYEGESR